MEMVLDDLKVVKAIGPEDTALISIATQQLALAAVKAADAEHIPAGRLTHVRDGLEGVRLKLEDTPQAEHGAGQFSFQD